MSSRHAIDVADEPPAEERAAQRRAARRLFRVYCITCSRSTEAPIAPSRVGRCAHCGGTLLVELATG
jgi:DNA-directed RNA polymerase subunit RPC12/RpoP